jgi:uncharacterized RDD family membrane protein YckC
VSEDLTHYDVLGVPASADKDAIKSAYQTRLSEVQADVQREQGSKKPDQSSLDGYRREEASVRNAWQVLSDPYQRGRYDATIEMVGDGTVDEADADVDDAPVPARVTATDRRGRPLRERPPGLFSTAPLPVPSSWPAGFNPPPPRARVLAMFIDMTVLALIFFIGFFVAGPAVIDEMYPKESAKLDLVNECQDRLLLEQDREPRSAVRIARAEDYCINTANVELASASRRENRGKEARLEDDLDRAEDRARDLQGKIALGTYGLQFTLIALMLLYLVPSSARTGKTLGKRLFQIRVVQVDGSPMNTRAAIGRYGIVVLAAMFLGAFIFPLGFALVLFGVLAWQRNPNLQGMHDRMAKTIVVDG